MAMLIDTAMVPARERLDFWLESSTDAYLPIQIHTTAKEQFCGQMWGYGLGPLCFFRISAASNTMTRTAQAIAACDPECLQLSLVLRGTLNATQEGRRGRAGIGDLISYETSHPVVFRADEPFESLIVRIPRQLLGRDADRISKRTALRIPGGQGLPRAAAAFFRGVVSGLEDRTVTANDTPNAVECILDLVRGIYAEPTPSPGQQRLRAQSRAELLLEVKAYIEANLGDPELDPQRIARANFISTRYLHKLFEGEGTSVCRWIRTTRLERCRRDLLDPALDHQTILAIATHWGLPVPQHFSRLFHATYDCSPSELRRRSHASPL
jgi:AraC-like DNA-binding protein